MPVSFKKRKVNTDHARKKEEQPEADEGAKVVIEVKEKSRGLLTSSNANDSNKDKLTIHTVFASHGAEQHRYGGDAFATNQINTAEDRDYIAIMEKSAAVSHTIATDDAAGVSLYKGMNAVKSYTSNKDVKETLANAKASGTVGPLRAPTNLRATARFDYQPNICKDYKETGTCGYGDSCVFMHDRGDYKSGWQLEKDWDANEAKKKQKLDEGLVAFMEGEEEREVPLKRQRKEGEEEDKDDEELPFACFICRGDFKNPVVTACGHYFCGPCIMSQRTKRCPVCQKQTSGIFNVATKLIKKLKERNGQKL